MAFPTSCLAHLPVHGVWKTHPIGHDLANCTWRIENGEHQYIVKQYSHDAAFGRQTGDTIQLDAFTCRTRYRSSGGFTQMR